MELITISPDELIRPFRLSRGRDPAGLRASIGENGLLRPPLVYAGEDGRFRLLSGRRRLDVLADLGFSKVRALLLFSPDNPPPAPSLASPDAPPPPCRGDLDLGVHPRLFPFLLEAAALENIERGFNQAELALLAPAANLLLAAGASPENPRDERVFRILRLFGFDNPKLLLGATRAAGIPGDTVLDALASGALDLENVLDLEAADDREIEAVAELFSRVTPSRADRKIWTGLLDDLKRIEGKSLDVFLGSPAFKSLSSGNDGKTAKNLLLSARHPKLSAFRERRKKLMKALGLPGDVSLVLKDNLEDTDALLEIRFKTRKELEGNLKTTLETVGSAAFDEFWNDPWTGRPGQS